jgi:hypothetical protein
MDFTGCYQLFGNDLMQWGDVIQILLGDLWDTIIRCQRDFHNAPCGSGAAAGAVLTGSPVLKRLNLALQSGHSTGANARGVHTYPHDGHFLVFVMFVCSSN